MSTVHETTVMPPGTGEKGQVSTSLPASNIPDPCPAMPAELQGRLSAYGWHLTLNVARLREQGEKMDAFVHLSQYIRKRAVEADVGVNVVFQSFDPNSQDVKVVLTLCRNFYNVRGGILPDHEITPMWHCSLERVRRFMEVMELQEPPAWIPVAVPV